MAGKRTIWSAVRTAWITLGVSATVVFSLLPPHTRWI